MKKTRLKQLLSIILAVLMTTIAIPLYVSAEDITPTAGFLDSYDTQTEFIIDSAEDWYAVAAAADKSFAGKTVKLGATIDFGGKSVPTLFQAFRGTFDGGKFTIKNAIVTGDALLANRCIAATVKDVIFENIHKTVSTSIVLSQEEKNETNDTEAAGYAIAVARFNGKASGITVKNSSVKVSSDISYDKNDTSSFVTAGGILFGSLCQGQDTINSIIENCTVDGCEGDFMLSGGGIAGFGRKASTIRNCTVSNTNLCGQSEGLGGIYGKANGWVAVDIDGCTVRDVTLTYVDKTASGFFQAAGLALGYTRGDHANTSITNCNLNGYIFSTAGAFYSLGGVVGGANASADRTIIIKNNQVEVEITSTSYGKFGGLVGSFCNDVSGDNASLIIESCNVSGKINANREANRIDAGSAVGFCHAENKKIHLSVIGVDTNMAINNKCTDSNSGTSGLIGTYGTVNPNGLYQMPGTVTVKNCHVGGSVSRPGKNSVGGIFGYYGAGGSVANVDNVVITATFPNNPPKTDVKDASQAGMVIGRAMRCDGIVINVKNCVTTNDMTAFYDIANGGKMTYNDTVYETDFVAHRDGSMITVTSEQAQSIIHKNEQCFITSVGGHQDANYFQLSEVKNGKYNIRFVVPSLISQAKEAGITVLVKDEAGNVIKTFTTKACELYHSLIGNTELGIVNYDASDFNAITFMAITITNVPTGSAYTFDVTPYYVNEYNVKTVGETAEISMDANGNPLNA